MTKRIILTAVVIFLIIIGFLPIFAMAARSIMLKGRIDFSSYHGILASARQWALIGHSLVLSLLTALFAVLIGLPLGILLAKTDLPLRRVFTVLFTIPLLLPPYITAISWFDLLGREGILVHILGPSVSQVASAWLFGLGGCVLVLFSAFLPIVMLLAMTYLRTVDPQLEEAGRLVSGWPRILRKITVPVILPGVMLAGMLVFLLTLGEFGVPAFLRYDVFPVESFTQFSAFYNFEAATASAIPLAAVTLLVLVLERIFFHEKPCRFQPAPGIRGPLMIRLGSLRKWFLALVGLFCLCIVVVPLLVLIVRSLSVGAYREAISKSWESLLRSLTYAAVGASFLTILGFLLGYLIHNRALPVWRSVDSLTILLFAFPGTVIGIGLISLWNRPLTNFIYATPAIIILGYLARYTALASRITVSTLARISPSMEEAAMVAGAGWLRRLALVVAPLARRGLVAGWLVGYIFCLRDMGITMIVYPSGHDTLPVRIFTLMANGRPELIAALCVIMVAVTLLPLGTLGLAAKNMR